MKYRENFTVILGWNTFAFESREQLTAFFHTMFSHSLDRKILYDALAESMKAFFYANILNEVREARRMIRRVSAAMEVLYDLYAGVYDPNGVVYSMNRDDFTI